MAVDQAGQVGVSRPGHVAGVHLEDGQAELFLLVRRVHAPAAQGNVHLGQAPGKEGVGGFGQIALVSDLDPAQQLRLQAVGLDGVEPPGHRPQLFGLGHRHGVGKQRGTDVIGKPLNAFCRDVGIQHHGPGPV